MFNSKEAVSVVVNLLFYIIPIVCGDFVLFVVGLLFSCCPTICPSITFCLLNILESLLDFHQTLQTCSYMQDKCFNQKSKGYRLILLELFPFVVLNGFLYRVLCLCHYSK